MSKRMIFTPSSTLNTPSSLSDRLTVVLTEEQLQDLQKQVLNQALCAGKVTLFEITFFGVNAFREEVR